MDKSIFIIHYQPLEYYPPVQNIIRFLEENQQDRKVYVFTTKPAVKGITRFTSGLHRIKIITLGKVQVNQLRIKRFLHYQFFNIRTFLQLCVKRPPKVLYIETLSSFPAYLYKKTINPKADILIHYHEYTSPAEYRDGMVLAKKFHRYEQYLYPLAVWVSHTNQDRMQKFLEDIYPVKIKAPHILPNYPPRSWAKYIVPAEKKDKLMIVYAGALGMETMYLKEFAEWVEEQEGRVQWHIYSQQDGSELISMLTSICARNIHFKGNVSYSQLAATLGNYDIGVILYKGHIPNYIFNAPNKLFEYAACGLDIWFPQQMIGSHAYITTGCFPKIVPLDFDKLKEQITPAVLSHEGLQYKPSPYFCENILPDLAQYLNN